MTILKEIQRYNLLIETSNTSRFIKVIFNEVKQIMESEDPVTSVHLTLKKIMDELKFFHSFSGVDELILEASITDFWIGVNYNQKPISYEFFEQCLFSISEVKPRDRVITNQRFLGQLPTSITTILEVMPNLIEIDEFFNQNLYGGEFVTLNYNHIHFRVTRSSDISQLSKIYGVSNNVLGEMVKHLVKAKKLNSELFNNFF
jgi:hypothetical protein